MDRKNQLETWLKQVLPSQTFSLTTASADASFRRYFRVHLSDKTLIAMDAPPPQEDCAPFVKVAQMLVDAGLNAPKVIAQDLERGFLLLSDLGDDTYLQHLNSQKDNHKLAQMLYLDATNALIKMQLASKAHDLPPYDEALLTREMKLFPDWYVAKHLGFSKAGCNKPLRCLIKIF
jgi:N-acetylmuramate 1-kinase